MTLSLLVQAVTPSLPFPGAGEPSEFTVPIDVAAYRGVVGGDGRLYVPEYDGVVVGRSGSVTAWPGEEVELADPLSWAPDGTAYQWEIGDDAIHARKDKVSIWANTALRAFYATGFGVDYGVTHSDLYRVDRASGELIELISEGGTWGRHPTGEARANSETFALASSIFSDRVEWFDIDSLERVGEMASGGSYGGVALFEDASAVELTRNQNENFGRLTFYSSKGEVASMEEVSAHGSLTILPAGNHAFLVEELRGLRQLRVWRVGADGSVIALGEMPGTWPRGASESGHLVTEDRWKVACAPPNQYKDCWRAEVYLVSENGEAESIFATPMSDSESFDVNDLLIGFDQVWAMWSGFSHDSLETEHFVTSVLAPVDGDPRYHSHMLAAVE